MIVGETIKELRRGRGISQQRFAEIAGITQPQLSDLENGRWEAPRQVLIQIARAFDAPHILTAAIRSSALMMVAVKMMGLESSADETGRLLAMIRAELDSLQTLIPSPRHPRAEILTHASRLADLANLLQILLRTDR